MSEYPVGQRVTVYDGDGTTYLGEGEYQGDFEAWALLAFTQTGEITLLSTPTAEKPTEDFMLDHGLVDGKNCFLKKLPENPKILMDDGSIKWGCQVWWEPANKEN